MSWGYHDTLPWSEWLEQHETPSPRSGHWQGLGSFAGSGENVFPPTSNCCGFPHTSYFLASSFISQSLPLTSHSIIFFFSFFNWKIIFLVILLRITKNSFICLFIYLIYYPILFYQNELWSYMNIIQIRFRNIVFSNFVPYIFHIGSSNLTMLLKLLFCIILCLIKKHSKEKTE